eukprot:scaffold10178_cov83-Skeletonema_dohrnii-CCMP3373.AAC.2
MYQLVIHRFRTKVPRPSEPWFTPQDVAPPGLMGAQNPISSWTSGRIRSCPNSDLLGPAVVLLEMAVNLIVNHQTRRTSGRNVDDCQFRSKPNQKG